ncbi:hypothetical protein [Maribacter sp. 2304DJ31-5]|uniref:hypothetical protein n=1 Tax=Maribacter sp. 2304DJ31-5 TaxID=3386273 RepID=UPI0039BD6BF0
MIPKDFPEFEKTRSLPQAPSIWPEALKALWYEAKGDWESSHNIAQDMHDHLGSWIHAYLHRKEGDRFNAGYWYGQAGKPYPENNLEEELRELVIYVLNRE